MKMSRAAACLIVQAICTFLVTAHESGATDDEPKYRFLVVLALGGHSPSMDVLAVSAALAQRGHRVSVVVPEADIPFSRRAARRHVERGDELVDWWPYDMPYHVGSDHLRALAMKIAKGRASKLSLFSTVQSVLARPCGLLLSNQTLLQAMKAGSFDAVISFSMPGDRLDSCGCAAAHLLGVPLVLVYGLPLLKSPLNVPQFSTGLSEDELPTWRGRVINLMHYSVLHSVQFIGDHVNVRGIRPIRSALGLPLGPARSGCTCSSALILNIITGSFRFEPPRQIGPPHALVGAIGPRAARFPFEPPEAADFIFSAPAGAVLVSFGSVPFLGQLLEAGEFEQMTLAFADLAPVRVLWLLKNSSLPEGVTKESLPIANNTLALEWVDINDAVGHPNTILFVTHGGMHSSYEALLHGKPILGIPFQFEQFANLKRLKALGLGDISGEAVAARRKGVAYTREGLRDAMRKVLSNPSYAEAAAQAGATSRLLARARPPLAEAVIEVEAAMLHKNYGRFRPYHCGSQGGTNGGSGGIGSQGDRGEL